jgi:hypothetical protein
MLAHGEPALYIARISATRGPKLPLDARNPLAQVRDMPPHSDLLGRPQRRIFN